MINVGVFRPTECKWYLMSGRGVPGVWDAGIVYDGFGLSEYRDGKTVYLPSNYTTSDLYPLVGDWTGKGFDSIGVYREMSTRFWLRNSNTPGAADLQIVYGSLGDIPLVGDWTGKGFDSIGVYRPSECKFYLRYSNTPGDAEEMIHFGDPRDVPLVGDWNGMGFDSVGVYRRDTRTFYLRTCDSYRIPYTKGTIAVTYGNPGDVPLVGDWMGNGIDSIGLYRPSERKFFLRSINTPGQATEAVIQYGNPGDTPVVGNWQ